MHLVRIYEYLPVTIDRLLMPIFTPGSVCNIADDMLDIVSQLVLKWER